jgi:beta-glucuronidase
LADLIKEEQNLLEKTVKRSYLKSIIFLLIILQINVAPLEIPFLTSLSWGQQQAQDDTRIPPTNIENEEKFKLESLELKRQFDFGDQSSTYLTMKAWEALGKKDYEAVWAYTQKCIDLYEKEAKQQQSSLKAFPPREKHSVFNALNNVATCYFIRGEALMRQNKWPQARQTFQVIIEDFSFAQYWDPRGWFWKVAEKSQESIVKIDKQIRGETEDLVETKVKTPTSKLILFDPGTETIVDYNKYGRFENVGTENYRYIIIDQAGLVRACGEGVYPNTSSVRKNPGYLALKASQRLKGNHWDFLHTDDMQANFFKWNMAPEPPGIKQFYIAFILERAGLLTQAVKAYYAIVVHFPDAYGWTYWHTPWYVGPVAISKINYILRQHPELGMKLEGAQIKIKNSFDNDVRNDRVICNPGRLIKVSATEIIPKKQDLSKLKIVQRRGDKKGVQLVQYENGHWQLLVQGKVFVVRAVTYAPTKVGQSPDEGTLGNWMEEDFNQNGKIDGPYDAWVDKNGNNIQDKDEPAVGDFQLMKQMGVNSIRVYHHPAKINKKLLADLYENYGIMTIMGDFLGAYTIGSGADWYEGTDYTNPKHQKNMLESVKAMVNEFKNENWILFWLLGNENNYGVANNAKKNPRAYYKFVNQVAELVHKLDPTRPVALCNGDTLFLDIFAQEAPQVDIFGANAYRGKEGFVNLWQDVRDQAGVAALITEYGCGAYYEGKTQDVAEQAQAIYHRGSWEDIEYNMAGYGVGNALGGIVFEWLDEWWKAYEPARHDWKGQFYGPFPDGFMHEEWLGLCSQGDGSKSPFLRTLRKSYYVYQQLWKK